MYTSTNTQLEHQEHQQQYHNNPWIFSSFQKDAKLRVRERYWRPQSFVNTTTSTRQNVNNYNSSSSSSRLKQHCRYCIIPDALSWRKFLPLLYELVQHQQQQLPLVQWILLESVVEYLDHRSQSPVIAVDANNDNGNKSTSSDNQQHDTVSFRPEVAAVHERSKLQKLVEQGSLKIFCDLSIRDEIPTEDEFEWMKYDKMTIKDRNKHSLLRAANLWRNPNNSDTTFIILWNDNDSQLQAEDDVQIMDMDNLLKFFEEISFATPQQLDLWRDHVFVCLEEYTKHNSVSKSINLSSPTENYFDYWHDDVIQAGLRQGSLSRGRFVVSSDNNMEAYVRVDQQSYFIDLKQRRHNRALHNDMVVIEPLPEAEWGRPVGRKKLVFQKDNNDDDDDNTVETNSTLSSLRSVAVPAVPSAQVVAITQFSRRSFVATLVAIPTHDDERAVIVTPMDLKIPKIRIVTQHWRNYLHKRLWVQVDSWDVSSTYPHGRCLEILGPIGDLETEVECLLREQQVDLQPFSLSALSCLPVEGSNWTVSESITNGRRDLRKGYRVFSVDPQGCQDIDDTMHAKILPNGDVEVGVHIADVTAFVDHNSALDLEAQKRATTFYLVDRRFDMLPSLLSSNLCSLHSGVDRLTVSVIWTISKDLEVKDTWYGRTVIHNCAAMTYEQADNILHDKPPEEKGAPLPPPLTAGSPVKRNLIPELKKDLSILTKLARKLKQTREDIGGAVDLSSGDIGSELKFTIQNGKPTQIVTKKDKEIHRTIAELMIMANTSVAEKIHHQYPNTALLRKHQTVEEDRFEDLNEVLSAGGVKFDGSSNMALAQSLKTAETNANGTVKSLFLSLATRAMSEALYVCSGSQQEDGDFKHYGLGLEMYTHFTSPIRRYADIVVHKQLLAALNKDHLSMSKNNKVSANASSVQQVLTDIPDSAVISVLDSDMDDDLDIDSMLDSLIAGASDMVLNNAELKISNNVQNVPEKHKVESSEPYNTLEVSRICVTLNLHNRLAKICSMESQKLFLSLYFRQHSETVQAVVTNLRSNGFYCYVPKFDLRAPVYLQDATGCVQIDPVLLGLRKDDGLPATLAFAANEACRRFPNATIQLIEGRDERLEVKHPGGKLYIVRKLDVVNVLVCNDNWDDRARIPYPKLQLVRYSSLLSSKALPGGKISTSIIEEKNADVTPRKDIEMRKAAKPTLYSLYHPRITPNLPSKVVQSSNNTSGIDKSKRKETLVGRIIFGDFVNPDTRMAQQEAAQKIVAAESAQRRANAMERVAQRREYDVVQNIERNTTVRQQRLAADKRNTRRSKAN